ncbi:3-hydroxyisobutyryl-CoA hydrolase [Microbacterium sp. X-17]|uniref:3-hydroxyisobutyryl-CoA hydrolase n=1 Tax=Microbacterium sp. X-17 TaxID=3144404 RepID=UPI0031F49E42
MGRGTAARPRPDRSALRLREHALTEYSDVLVERRGRLGLLTLDRPRALNALTHPMVRRIAEAIATWADDDTVGAVAITGAGPRGLCAGGDIVALYRDATEGDGSASRAFWADEYRLDLALARYPKPVVAIQDGLVLGGGIGISAHCSHRVVTERSRLGLPEVGIGFAPDVGATWLLSRAPGRLGLAIGMTGLTVGAGDALALGLSDHSVPSGDLAGLLAALETQEPDAAIAAVAQPAPVSGLLADRDWIDEVFAAADVPAIVERLRGQASERAAELAAALDRVSPTSAAVALRGIRTAAGLGSLAEALVQEYRVSCHAFGTAELREGIRAQVIDKDRAPRWRPATHDAVTPEAVAAYFAAPVCGDLDLT